jgi:hypothetical protein
MLSAADKPDNLDFVTFPDDRLIVLLPLDNRHVVFDGDDARVDVQLGEQGTDRDRAGDFERLAVQSYGHKFTSLLESPGSLHPV